MDHACMHKGSEVSCECLLVSVGTGLVRFNGESNLGSTLDVCPAAKPEALFLLAHSHLGVCVCARVKGQHILSQWVMGMEECGGGVSDGFTYKFN